MTIRTDKEARDVRIRMIPDRFDGKVWHMAEQPIVEVTSKAWITVRRADIPSAAPFVISRKEWEKLRSQASTLEEQGTSHDQ